MIVRAWAIAIAAALVLGATSARAGEAEARASFAAGVKAYDGGDYATALRDFEQAYAQKPSPGIRRNVALCLRALHRYPEAIEALQAMLAEGGDALDPKTREAAQRAIDEMSASVAQVRVRVVQHAPEGARPQPVTLRIDDREVPMAKASSGLLLGAGEHVFRAEAAGFADAVQEVALNGGEKDRVVTIEMVGISTAPTAGRDAASDVDSAGPSVAERPPPPPPPEYVPDEAARAAATATKRTWYVMAGGTLASQTRTIGGGLDVTAVGTSKSFASTGLTLRGGRALARWLDLEALLEIGGFSETHTMGDVSVHGSYWALVPELRFHTTGAVRFIGGVGLGYGGESLTATSTDGAVRSGASDGVILALEIGGQVHLGRHVFLEGDAFWAVRGGTSARTAGDAWFDDSASARVGGRALVGWNF